MWDLGLDRPLGKSYNDVELKEDRSLELSRIAAPPSIAINMKYNSRIYNIYKSYISSEDIHVYSIDEVLIDVTSYLQSYGHTAHKLVAR